MKIKKLEIKKLLLIIMLTIISVTAFGDELITNKFKSEINLNNVALADGVALLTNATGVNIIASSDIENKKINVYANKGTTLKEVLGLIERSYGLTEVKLKDSILLIKENKKLSNVIGRAYGSSSETLSGVKIELLNSNYGTSQSSKEGIFVLSNIKPGIYIMKVSKPGYQNQSSILRLGEGERVIKDISLAKDGEKAINANGPKDRIDTLNLGSMQTDDKPNHTQVERVQLKYTRTSDMVKVLNGLFQGNQLNIKEYPADQVLILNGTNDSIEIAKKVLNEVDNPVKEVRITAQVLETTNNLFEDLGFNWLFSDKKSTLAANVANQHFEGGLLKDGTSSVLKFANIFNGNKNLLNVSIDMLQTTNDITVSSVPSVTVINGEEATFKVTQEVNAGIKTTKDGDTGDEDSTPIFKEAGTVFKVTPIIRQTINGKNKISLKVSSEISSFEDDPLDKSNYIVPLRLKRQNNIETNIELEDGATVFIGGLKTKRVSNIVKKVPILGDIPYLGALFRNKSTQNEVKQVYIEIKAEVIEDNDGAKEFSTNGFKPSPLTTGEVKRTYPKIGEEVIDTK